MSLKYLVDAGIYGRCSPAWNKEDINSKTWKGSVMEIKDDKFIYTAQKLKKLFPV